MEEPRTWQELLGQIIRDPLDKQRLSNELGIHPMTLTRWVNGQPQPRLSYLRQLIRAVPPQYRQKLVDLLKKEYGEHIFDPEQVELQGVSGIPAAFYARVLHGNATNPPIMRSSSIITLILQQALGHLDPDEVGMSITVVRCLAPPTGQRVRSLRETIGRGTPPWSSHLDNQPLLLGAESLAGYSVISSRLIANQDIASEFTFFPVRRTRWEESAAACPLLHDGRVAGCVLASSARKHYFSDERMELLQQYTHLMVLAFEPEDFYDSSQIALGILPPASVQQPHFAQFQSRVTELMRQSQQNNRPLTRPQAEQIIWWQLEEKLLQARYDDDAYEDSTA